MEPAFEMSFPGTDMEIEIMLSTVRLGRRRWKLCFRRGGLFFGIFLTHESHDPIRLPSLASVIRECLFKAARIRSDVPKPISRENHSAIEFLLVEEFATTILEFANHWFVDYTVAAIRPIQAPLVSFGIV